jgi:hypothetical protein
MVESEATAVPSGTRSALLLCAWVKEKDTTATRAKNQQELIGKNSMADEVRCVNGIGMHSEFDQRTSISLYSVG